MEALKFGHEAVKLQCAAQMELLAEMGGRKPVREYNHEDNDAELRERVIAETSADIRKVAESGAPKNERTAALRLSFRNIANSSKDMSKNPAWFVWPRNISTKQNTTKCVK